MKRMFVPISVLLLLIVGVVAAEANLPDTERAALIALYDSTGGSGWTYNTNWRNTDDTDFNDPGTECTWRGVVCDGDPPHVSRIVLVNNNLVGTLPLELRDLDDLAILDVRNNRISGEIPSTIAGLPIGTLRLAGNWMTGSIDAICGLSQVIDVDLTRNYFSGPVPSCIQHLTGLRTLDLVTANAPDNNNFDEGPLPTWLLDLPALQYLSLGQVSGTIPEWIEQLNGLRAFGLVRSPNLTGRNPIPNRADGALAGARSARYRSRTVLSQRQYATSQGSNVSS